MELKTKIKAAEGEQQLVVTRSFNLPVDLLFKAFNSPEFLSQWMGTRVKELVNQPLGQYQFETKDPAGNIVFQALGTIHRVKQDAQIVRTFEMLNAPFDVQLEYLDFISLGDNQSELHMQIIYRSKEIRDQNLKLPFASGISHAHDRLEAFMLKLDKKELTTNSKS